MPRPSRSPGGRSRSAKRLSARSIPTVATYYNNLAALLQAQGKYAEAEPLFRRAIEIDEKTLGKDHPDVATRYNNLAFLLQDPGQVCRGRAALSAGDRDRRKDSRQGASRPLRLGTTISPLLLQAQGKYAEAEPLFRRAIEIGEKTLGKEHPDVATATTISPLASGPGQVCRGRAALSAGDRDRRKGSRQGASRRCDLLQQSRLIASGPGQVCRGRAALSAGYRDWRKDSRQGASRRCDRLQQSRLYCFRTRANMPRPSRSSAGHRDRRKGSRQGASRRCDRLQQSRHCFRPRASMPRPSRSFGGRSRSAKRLSARSIPTLRPVQQSRHFASGPGQVCRGRAALSAGHRDRRKDSRQGASRRCDPATTISPYCFRTRASMPRPSRSIGGPSRYFNPNLARSIQTLSTAKENYDRLQKLKDQNSGNPAGNALRWDRSSSSASTRPIAPRRIGSPGPSRRQGTRSRSMTGRFRRAATRRCG